MVGDLLGSRLSLRDLAIDRLPFDHNRGCIVLAGLRDGSLN